MEVAKCFLQPGCVTVSWHQPQTLLELEASPTTSLLGYSKFILLIF